MPYKDPQKQKVAEAASRARLREHRRLKQKARRAEIREWVRSLKEGKPCVDCGHSFHFAAMDWDHLPGYDKVGQVNRLLLTYNKQVVLDEIAKCDLVCSNCHRVRSYERGEHLGLS